MNINEAFSSDESKEIYDKFLAIVSSRRDNLVKKYGKEAERIAYASAVNQVKKKAGNNIEEPTTEEPMDQEQKLKEMIQAALSNPLNEKKKSFPDLTGDGKVTKADILKARGVIDEFETGEELIADEPISEDLDLGHEDNEPHMIKAELAHIARYAIELYKMVDQFEGPQEVDFPAWWQSKLTTARNMISSAKHYLEFELDEPKIDAMVGVASEEDVIDEEMTPEKSRKKGMPFKNIAKEGILDEKMSKKQIKKRGEIYDTLKDKGMSDEKAGKISTSQAMKAKIKEAVLAKLQESKGEYAQIEKKISDLQAKGKNAGDPEMQKLIKRRAELEKSKK